MAIIEPIIIGTPTISPKFANIGNNRIMHPIRNMISPLINLCVIKSIYFLLTGGSMIIHAELSCLWESLHKS